METQIENLVSDNGLESQAGSHHKANQMFWEI